MAKKPTLTCTTPHGTFTRGTYRPYTHVVVAIHADGKGNDLSWHSSRALALQARTNLNCAPCHGERPTLEIFPVDQEALRGSH